MRKYSPLLILLSVFLFAGFMESPSQSPLDSPNYPGSVEMDDTETSANQEDARQATTFELEMVFEGTKIVEGAKVETYREYEIYKDENGHVVKEIPTSNYNYLRYENN